MPCVSEVRESGHVGPRGRWICGPFAGQRSVGTGSPGADATWRRWRVIVGAWGGVGCRLAMAVGVVGAARWRRSRGGWGETAGDLHTTRVLGARNRGCDLVGGRGWCARRLQRRGCATAFVRSAVATVDDSVGERAVDDPAGERAAADERSVGRRGVGRRPPGCGCGPASATASTASSSVPSCRGRSRWRPVVSRTPPGRSPARRHASASSAMTRRVPW